MVPYHIYVHTPPLNGSDYIPHLLEHAVLWGGENGERYFENLDVSAESYTYYACFTVLAESPKEIEDFCVRISGPIPDTVLAYEAKVLRKELETRKYFQLLISKIGKRLYGNMYRYSTRWRSNRETLRKYHGTYYMRWNMVILETDAVFRDIVPDFLGYESVFEIRLRGEKEVVAIGKYTPEGVFVNELLQGLLDGYIDFRMRYGQGEYFSSETLAGEFDDAIFLSVGKGDIPLVTTVPESFVESFVEYGLSHFSMGSYRDVDGPTMLKYGYGISEKSKREIIRKLPEYYEGYRRFLLDSGW